MGVQWRIKPRKRSTKTEALGVIAASAIRRRGRWSLWTFWVVAGAGTGAELDSDLDAELTVEAETGAEVDAEAEAEAKVYEDRGTS